MKLRQCTMGVRAIALRVIWMCWLFIIISNAGAQISWTKVDDPSLKEALFDSYSGQHFTAITRLKMAQKLNRVISQDQSALVLGGLYLAYGYHNEAANLFNTLLGKDQPREVRDQAWFYLAKTYYQSNRMNEALSALNKIGNSLIFDFEQEVLVLRANVYMQIGNYLDALKTLKQVNERSEWGAYAKYNKGVATYQMGRKLDGIQILDEVGNMSAGSSEYTAIRDKANLVLGYGYLDRNEPDKAKQVLERMRLQGPFTNKAMLALGRVYSDQNNHKKSLSPWLELIKRNPSDPAVQDAMMAVPFAFGQLEAYKQALEYYEKAMLVFQTEIEKINHAAEAISGGKLFEGLILAETLHVNGNDDEAYLKKVLDTPEGHYMLPLLSSYEFRQTLHNFAQLRLSLGKLEGWSAALHSHKGLNAEKRKEYDARITKLQSRTLLAVEKQRHHINSLAFAELDRRKQRLVSYFNEARFSVAQIYDYASKRWGTGNE